jgi:sugar (pentulose or hexulose) kinase
MKSLLIGIDIGTTRIKAVATDLQLQPLGEATLQTPWRHENNLSDIDLELLASTVIGVASKVATIADGQARAIGITGLAETGALIDGDGNPLAPGLAWYDPRSDCDLVEREIGADTFQRLTGAAITSVPSLPKILWLQNKYPNAKKAEHFLSVPEWIVKCLGGETVSELSLVSRTGLFNISKKAPWEQGIELVGGKKNFLGRIVSAGESVGIADSNSPENLRGAVLTIAGQDHQSAAYHSGAMRDGYLFDSMGTAEAILRIHKGLISEEAISRLAKEGINTGWTVVPDHLVILAGLPAGISFERIGSLLGAVDQGDRNRLGELALLANRDHHEVAVNGNYHGVSISNITDGVSPALLWRAAVEDLNAICRSTLELINREIAPETHVIIAGGWIHNPMVYAEKVRQFEEFEIVNVPEAGAMGAAEFAGVALGQIPRR